MAVRGVGQCCEVRFYTFLEELSCCPPTLMDASQKHAPCHSLMQDLEQQDRCVLTARRTEAAHAPSGGQPGAGKSYGIAVKCRSFALSRTGFCNNDQIVILIPSTLET